MHQVDSTAATPQDQDIAAEHNLVDVRRTDQAQLSHACTTADIANESSTEKQKIEQPTPKRTTEISPPCKNLKNGEVTKGSLLLIARPEKDIDRNLTTELFSCPSEGLTEHPVCASDCDSSCRGPTIVDFSLSPLSNIEAQQVDFSKTQVQSSEKNLAVQSPPDVIETPDHQRCRRNGNKWHCSNMPSPGKRYCEKHLLEQSIYNAKRRKGLPRGQSYLISSGSGEISSFNSESIVREEDDLRCRRNGNRWRCHEMASPGKRYCMNHYLKQSIYNKKRRTGPPRGQNFLVSIGSDERRNFEGDHSKGEGLSDNPTPSFSHEMVISFPDSHLSGTSLKITDSSMSPHSDIKKGVQSGSSKTEAHWKQKNLSFQCTSQNIRSLGGDVINQQEEGVGKHTTTALEGTGMVSGTLAENPKHIASNTVSADVPQTECTAKETEILLQETCSTIEDVQPSLVLLEVSSPGLILAEKREGSLDAVINEISQKLGELQESTVQ